MYKLITRAVFFLALFILAFFSLSGDVKASGGCVPVYGGGTECPPVPAGCTPIYGGGVECPRPGQILIDKKVLNPATAIFVDNLGPTDPKYRPSQFVTFQILVKNSGDQSLSTVTVTDKIPQFVDFISGPGSFDSNSKTLSFTVKDLPGGISQLYTVKGRTVHQALLPQGKNIVCPVNVVDAASDNQKDHDESQFCIEKEMVVPLVPEAGPEHWILTFGGLTTVLIAGVYLRKKVYLD